jgi:hypothetical protein
MISLFGGKSLRLTVKTSTLIAAMVLTLVAVVPCCRAERDSSNPSGNLDKHARKIRRELTHFKTGSYVHIVFRDGSERTGALDSVDDGAFTVSNAETNARETHDYSDIERVTHQKYYIGEGSEGHAHHIPLWIPVTVGALAAGAALTAIEVR